MNRLTHFRLCPLSRSARLALSEHGLDFELVEERAWEWRAQFLALNPAGELPVLEMENRTVLCGAYAVAEYLDEQYHEIQANRRGWFLFPGNSEDRAEVRRVVDWFQRKFHFEVSLAMLQEKIEPMFAPSGQPRPPDPERLRAARANLGYHLGYIEFLVEQRRWLAGDEPSYGDLAGAAHLSLLDFLNEIDWDAYPQAKSWYVRLKSRPSFRALLADRIAGYRPPAHYADLDF